MEVTHCVHVRVIILVSSLFYLYMCSIVWTCVGVTVLVAVKEFQSTNIRANQRVVYKFMFQSVNVWESESESDSESRKPLLAYACECFFLTHFRNRYWMSLKKACFGWRLRAGDCPARSLIKSPYSSMVILKKKVILRFSDCNSRQIPFMSIPLSLSCLY